MYPINRRKFIKIVKGFATGVAATKAITISSTLGIAAVAQASNLKQNQRVKLASRVNTRLEFVGPFSSWSNLKRDYGAVGDGIADDTAAIQQALNQLGNSGNASVLYLPAGTYRVRNTLVMTSHINVSIVGEHRETTIIKWDGSAGGTILALNGVRYSRFGRINWDGSGTGVGIDQSWDGQTPNFDTANEYICCKFQDLAYGIQAGNLGHGAAESVVWNCHFIRNSLAGIITKNFNALDWFVWYCLFRDCAVGVTNDPGAGNFHVMNSVFLNSTQADIEMRNTSYFSVRNNYSRNSKAFFVAKGIGQNGAPTTIQDNRVVNSVDDAAIRIENLGPILLLDNRIKSRSQAASPVVVHRTFTAVDFVSVGNQFTVNNPIDVNGRAIAFDDQVVAASIIDTTQPLLPSLPKLNRPVFDVSPGASASVIQQRINAADRQRGNRPIVHLSAGNYFIDRTLTIPAGSDVQLIGDGYNTALSWTGTSGIPMIRVAGPSHATLAELSIRGGASTGILLENVDQAKARVAMDQVYLDSAAQHNLLVDRLDRTLVELHNFYHSGCQGTSVKVVGGVSAARGSWLGGRTNIFAGASSNSNLSYEVTNGGRLLARDIWYETGYYPGFAKLTSQGTFTLHGARIAAPINQNVPAVAVDNFGGRVALVGVVMDDRIVVKGNGSRTRVLALGIQGNGDRTALVDDSPQAQTLLLNSRTYANGSYAVPNLGKLAANVQNTTSTQFLRSLLGPTRNNQPNSMVALAQGVTDVRLHRIRIEGGSIGIRLQN